MATVIMVSAILFLAVPGAVASRVSVKALTELRPSGTLGAGSRTATGVLGSAEAAIAQGAAVPSLAEIPGDVRLQPPSAEEVMRSLGTNNEGCAVGSAGERMGCEAGCRCRWTEQCYPKYVLLAKDSSRTTSNSTDWNNARVTVGVCGTAMPVLVLLSGVLFIGLLSCVVTVRMYAQWRESLAAPEALPHAGLLKATTAVREQASATAQFGVAAPTGSPPEAAGLTEQLARSSERTADDQPAVEGTLPAGSEADIPHSGNNN